MNIHKTSKRHAAILARLQHLGTATIVELADLLDVSGETIRRDAVLLEQKGEVFKLHGALTLPHLAGEAPFERRLRENAEAKRAIAKFAVGLVNDGDSLIIDTGTTTSIFAQELRIRSNLTIVTNSSDIARTLATVNGNTVYMAGGALKGDNGAAFGPSAVEFMSRFRVRHAFISIAAISVEGGLMDADLSEAAIAAMALSRAEHRVVLTDASKFGKTALVNVCGFDGVDRLITEQLPLGKLADALQQANVQVDKV
ncbi:MAG: DeoR/GlpR family DNA-binding transcription regulator [Aestuariivirga sp.]